MTTTTDLPSQQAAEGGEPEPRVVARPWWVIAGSVLLVVTIGWGTMQVVALIAREQWTEVFDLDDAVTSVEVSVDHGRVRIVTSDRAAPFVTGHISRGLWPVRRSVEVVGDRLVVTARCRGPEQMWCSTDYDVEVPAGTDVIVRSGSGTVRVDGEPGAVVADSGHGTVIVAGQPASVEARSGHGSIRVEGVGEIEVVARSGHGSVRVHAAAPPSSVQARSGHGRVEVVVPESDVAYRVDLATGHGNTVNAVRSDPTSTRLIELRSGHGDVEVRYAP